MVAWEGREVEDKGALAEVGASGPEQPGQPCAQWSLGALGLTDQMWAP